MDIEWRNSSRIRRTYWFVIFSLFFEPIKILKKHYLAYIYSLAMLDSNRFVSCGEDRCINIWHFNQVSQQLFSFFFS